MNKMKPRCNLNAKIKFLIGLHSGNVRRRVGVENMTFRTSILVHFTKQFVIPLFN